VKKIRRKINETLEEEQGIGRPKAAAAAVAAVHGQEDEGEEQTTSKVSAPQPRTGTHACMLTRMGTQGIFAKYMDSVVRRPPSAHTQHPCPTTTASHFRWPQSRDVPTVPLCSWAAPP
jgi:hypothetical protein